MPNTNTQKLVRVLCAIDNSKLSEKLKISPVGDAIRGLDGRVFSVNGIEQLAHLAANGLDLPLTVNHGDSDYGAESAGWFSEFELREDGIYASLELTDIGTTLIDNKRYKYLSPEYLMEPNDIAVLDIIGVGLVNQPNLLNQSLNHQKKESVMAMTDEEKDKQAALEAENKQLTEQVIELKKNQLAQKVDNAINKGELLPAKKQFALTLEENALNSFLELEAKNTVISKNSVDPERLDDGGTNDEIYSQLGL